MHEPPSLLSLPHLHQVDDVQEELVGVLLPVGGKLRVSFAHQSFEHSRRDAPLLLLESEFRHQPHKKTISQR